MIKRLFDILLALFGLVVMAPVYLVLALLVRFSDGGPVFFVHRRTGQNGVPFRMLKFRSMVPGSEKGAPLTVGADERITSLGWFLRSSKLDELPQLFNVLAGDMSFVGPRPEVAKFTDTYSEAQREVLRLRPGITDPSSFVFFNESELLAKVADPERFYREQVMPEKIRINLEYSQKAGVGTDLVLIIATVCRALGIRFDLLRWLDIEMPRLRVGQ